MDEKIILEIFDLLIDFNRIVNRGLISFDERKKFNNKLVEIKSKLEKPK